MLPKMLHTWYAFRPLNDPRAPELAYLSLYEFFRYWRIELAAYVVSDKDLEREDEDCFHARLTCEGWRKVSIRKYERGKSITFQPITDCLIKDEGGESWLAFPDIPELQKIRHTWILVRNERPLVPSFCKAPMPNRNSGSEERNARIVMTYFHPFTMQKDIHIEDVPHVSALRGEHEGWEQALLTWLSGNVLTHEARNIIQNFFLVAQMRPEFVPDANKNDEDIFSDEEIDREKTDVQSLLYTHTGATRINDEEENMADEINANKSRDAMQRASRMWAERSPKQESAVELKKDRIVQRKYSEDEIAQLKKEALRSQKQADHSSSALNTREASFEVKGTFSEQSLTSFLANLKEDASDKTARCNKDQKEIVERVVRQIIQDEHYRMDKRRKRPEQFIRLLHGGPGTGKSHVIKILKEKLFQEELQWTTGLDFQIAAFQAVNADNIDGDTLHHA